ncbi:MULTISPECIES: ABC transporter permease [unclassified Adlercreutzia]|uniref:ABC transporter permease n=1 Tax=unclassified Adlercreutzia TaxID=2636013 RepID=UPI0013EBF785|nr:MULTISPECIES: ABC transporter permease [unclassified Adlercreutzia]
MLLKLAARNIRRSVRDYAIYFVTLVFGVAVFYAFNSIGSQKILFSIEGADANIFEVTQELLSTFSVVIAFVLGFLIVYANRFLIKRRKHEFGIYLTLGMSPGKVSRIVLYETVIVGLVSLAVGLVCGVLLSQALSFATAALFTIPMTHYQFVFSSSALLMTLLCFVAIYVVVALFNLLTVRRYKLIDLLSANMRSERMPVRNPWVCLAAFVTAVGVLAVAYRLLIENGMIDLGEPSFVWATVLMLVGTLVFFWSLAGFAIAVITRARGTYLRGLVPFTVRQIASKVNTAFVSLWVICVLLFLSITTFSTGMGLIEVFCGDMEKAAPYDATIRADVYYEEEIDLARPTSESLTARAEGMAAEHPKAYADGEAYGWDIEAKLRDAIPTWGDFVKESAQIDYWDVPGSTYAPLVEAAADVELSSVVNVSSIAESNIQVVSVSQLNALRAMTGAGPLALADDECALVNNMDVADELARAFVEEGKVASILGHDLRIQDKILDVQFFDSSMESTALMFVVPDQVVSELRAGGAIPLTSYLNLTYADGLSPVEGDEALSAGLAQAFPKGSRPDLGNDYTYADDAYAYTPGLWPVTTTYTQAEMSSQADGLRMMITYLALYVGFIFLVATAAILAIQQLSEAADSQQRYRLLAKLGCDERALNRSLFAQVLVYFLAPLALAVGHSACAIGVLSGTLFEALGAPVQGPIMMAAGFTLVIYGGYLLITYFASRSIVKQAIRG